jgi:hypothetical protein
MSMSDGPISSTAVPALSGLANALGWYDQQAKSNRIAYQTLRITAIVLAAAIPVITTSGAPRLAAAILGSAIVVVEGIQQVFRYHDRYIAYRSTWNALDREQRLYNSRGGRYANNPNPEQSLAERVDQILAEENTRWASDMNTTTITPGK